MARFVAKQPIRIYAEDVILDLQGQELEREWIEVKPKLSFGDRNKITGAILSVSPQDRSLDMNLERYLCLILELSVITWNLYARDERDEVIFEGGHPLRVPFKKEYINDLDPDDPLITKVTDEIGRLNPTLGGGAAAQPTSST